MKKTGRPKGSYKFAQDFEASGMTLAAFCKSRAIEYQRFREEQWLSIPQAIERAMGCASRATIRTYKDLADKGVEPFFEVFRRFAEKEDDFRKKKIEVLGSDLEKKDPGRALAIFFPDLDPSAVNARAVRELAVDITTQALAATAERFEAEASEDLTAQECAALLRRIIDAHVTAMSDTAR